MEQVIAYLFTSPEYAALTGSDSGFVMGLYNVLLGRTGSSGEVAGYVERAADDRPGRRGECLPQLARVPHG